jgi:hypothetical protein
MIIIFKVRLVNFVEIAVGFFLILSSFDKNQHNFDVMQINMYFMLRNFCILNIHNYFLYCSLPIISIT